MSVKIMMLSFKNRHDPKDFSNGLSMPDCYEIKLK